MRTPTGIRAFLAHVHPRHVRESSAKVSYTWCLGGLSFWFFLIEAFTGALLLLHYTPSHAGAYPSILTMTHAAPYGFLVRNVHYWAGQFMVISMVGHMARVIVCRAYAPPRRLNWLIGIGLFVCALGVDFTGYLLVWDDRAIRAWTIARNLACELPYIGRIFSELLFGPAVPQDRVLARLYTWHVFIVPWIMGALCGYHFWRVRKDGISSPL